MLVNFSDRLLTGGFQSAAFRFRIRRAVRRSYTVRPDGQPSAGTAVLGNKIRIPKRASPTGYAVGALIPQYLDLPRFFK